ncbi:putative toxin-antitoxin system toxin component, PIN family [Microbacterium sp. M1A1_1b]
MHQRVFVDANVLCSRTLRDWTCLLRARVDGLFQLHTTEDVLAEVLRTLRRLHPERPGGAVTRLRAAVLASIDELVDDFDATVPYAGNDPDDRHVHAAAVACRADVLLTQDRGLAAAPQSHYLVSGCDAFFTRIDDMAPAAVRDVCLQQVEYWATRTSHPAEALVAALHDAGCPVFANRVRAHLAAIGNDDHRC